MENFEIEIADARRRRRNRIARFFGAMFISFTLFAVVYLYISSVKLEVVLKDYISDVQIYIVRGNAMTLGFHRVVLFSGLAEVAVSAVGYEPQIIQLKKAPARKEVVVELEYAAVDLYASPSEKVSNPLWYLDGVLVSSNANLQLSVKPGRHQIELVSDHHEIATLSLSAEPLQDQKLEVQVRHKLIDFRIATVPSHAEIFIGGQLVGTSPVVGVIPSSVVRVETRLSGFVSSVENVDLSLEIGPFARNYNLNPATHQVMADFKPADGQVFIDGRRTPLAKQLSIKIKGQTIIRYAKEGYRTKTIRVDEETKVLRFDLEPVYGRLTVKSEPPAAISIAGVAYGQTPAQLKLQTISQTRQLSRDGYVPQEITIEVTETDPQIVDAYLQTWSDYYLSQSKSRITNSVGIDLVRIRPESFFMGAPRSQQGQRANELLRKVAFSRSIYMSEHEITEHQYSFFRGETSVRQQPVTNISWQGAVLFCNWLSAKEGLQPFYEILGTTVIGFDASSRGYRLPSEAEWEYVARYRNKPEPTIFTWGNEYKITQAAGNIADEEAKGLVRTHIGGYSDGHKDKAVVRSFPKEVSGLFDLSGNVSEWMHDIYAIELPDRAADYMDFLGPARGSQHVVKGSNYLSSSWTEFRASFKESTDGERSDVGFRIARYIN